MSTDFSTGIFRSNEHVCISITNFIFFEEDDLIVEQRCRKCGKIFEKRRIKTEPYEEGDK